MWSYIETGIQAMGVLILLDLLLLNLRNYKIILRRINRTCYWQWVAFFGAILARLIWEHWFNG